MYTWRKLHAYSKEGGADMRRASAVRKHVTSTLINMLIQTGASASMDPAEPGSIGEALERHTVRTALDWMTEAVDLDDSPSAVLALITREMNSLVTILGLTERWPATADLDFAAKIVQILQQPEESERFDAIAQKANDRIMRLIDPTQINSGLVQLRLYDIRSDLYRFHYERVGLETTVATIAARVAWLLSELNAVYPDGVIAVSQLALDLPPLISR